MDIVLLVKESGPLLLSRSNLATRSATGPEWQISSDDNPTVRRIN
jgi:hypothetical protein